MKSQNADSQALEGLLQRVGSRDQSAFTELYRRTSPKLYGVCLRMLREPAGAEDVLQDSYVKVWQQAGRFDSDRASAMTWLITLTRNRAIDRLRQQRDLSLGDPADMERLEGDEPEPGSHAEASDDRQRLEHCLDELKGDHRQAVREAFFGGVTYKQLAERRGMPLGTIKSWIRRSLLLLRTCLDR